MANEPNPNPAPQAAPADPNAQAAQQQQQAAQQQAPQSGQQPQGRQVDVAKANDVANRVQADLQQLHAPGQGGAPAGAQAGLSFGGLVMEFLADLNLTDADVAVLKGLPPKSVQAIVRVALRHLPGF